MRYQYSNPNLRFIDLLSALVLKESVAEEKICKYFSGITGKRYILLTNSCRTALFLAYKAIGKKGDVITTPLTCKAAIDPITETGNSPVFADIDPGNLNIDPDDIEHRITGKTISIQVIHFGGVASNMEKISDIAIKNKLLVIEDCAQSLGAKFKGRHTGSFGDIACFTLAKNAYGTSGGILATDSEEIFTKASKIMADFGKPPTKLMVYRIIRNILSTSQNNPFSTLFGKILVVIKGDKKNYVSVINQLKSVSGPEKKIASHQITRFSKLHEKRLFVGRNFFNILNSEKIIVNNDFDIKNSSFTRFFIYNPLIDTKKHLAMLNNAGLEVMHLEHKKGSPYQEKLLRDENSEISGLPNYNKVHDCLLSLPLSETFSDRDIRTISNIIKAGLERY